MRRLNTPLLWIPVIAIAFFSFMFFVAFPHFDKQREDLRAKTVGGFKSFRVTVENVNGSDTLFYYTTGSGRDFICFYSTENLLRKFPNLATLPK